MKTRRRKVLWILVACLWLPTLLLALETYAALVRWRIDNYNPLILARQGLAVPNQTQQPAPPPPLETQRLEAPPWPLGHSTQESPDNMPEWHIPKFREPPEERQRRCRVFPQLSEDDRRLFAVLHMETVVLFERDGSPIRVYGNTALRYRMDRLLNGGWFYRNVCFGRQWRAFAGALDRAGSAVRTFCEDIPMRGLSHIEAYFIPDKSGSGFYAFLRVDMDPVIRQAMSMLPEDTPWDIPFVKYKANLRGARSGMGVTMDTNNFGFRDDDVVVPKPEGVFRIICVGGSTTEEGATNGATYPNLVENRLREAFPDRAIEVVNCGTSGPPSWGHLARLGEYLELEPDLIVLYIGVNDIRTYYELIAKFDGATWQRLLGLSHFACDSFNRLLYPSGATSRQRLASLSLANIEAMDNVATSRGIPVVLCSFAYPDLPDLEECEVQLYDYCLRNEWPDKCITLETYCDFMQIYNDEMKDVCRRQQICYIPVAENLKGGAEYFGDYCHMLDAGIQRKAQIIAHYIGKYIRHAV